MRKYAFVFLLSLYIEAILSYFCCHTVYLTVIKGQLGNFQVLNKGSSRPALNIRGCTTVAAFMGEISLCVLLCRARVSVSKGFNIREWGLMPLSPTDEKWSVTCRKCWSVQQTCSLCGYMSKRSFLLWKLNFCWLVRWFTHHWIMSNIIVMRKDWMYYSKDEMVHRE